MDSSVAPGSQAPPLARSDPQAVHGGLCYRRDIDGMRALAVLLVVVFHAFPHSMGGGYIGVDVFFVISGYLISGVIFEQLAAGSFSIVDFYVRRVRRIFPALLVVMIFCLAMGWLTLLSDEFQKLAKHVVAGATFVSNLVFWREAGYFDDDAALKPLLHLWSLGVEEQFYLIWPLLLGAMWKLRLRPLGVLGMLGMLLAASFVANLALIDAQPTAAFYLPLTRFWELMLGAGLAYATMCGTGHRVAPLRPALRETQSWLGLAMIGAAAALMNKGSRFPGYWALLPSLGAILILMAGPAAWLNRVVLSHRAMVYVGLISYPLYLWHWPLLAMSRIWHIDALPRAWSAAIVVASAGLAAATFHFVERPVRSLRGEKIMHRSALALAAAMVLVTGVAWLAWSGLVYPLSSRFAHMDEVARASQDIRYDRDRTIAGSEPTRVLMFGDSHMQQYLPRVERLLGDTTLSTRTAVFHTEGGCAPVPRLERAGRHCVEFVDKGMALALDPKLDTVVIAASWLGFMERGDYRATTDTGVVASAPLDLAAAEADWVFERWSNDLRRLRESGKRVVIVLSTPRADAYAPKRMVERSGLHFEYKPTSVSRADLEAQSALIDTRLRRVAQASGAIVVDPLDHFCDGSRCATTFAGSQPISTDGSHLRAAYVADRLPYLDEFLLVQR